nr:MAG TPA: hypothetical protein [Bacteriophage sp.]
MKRARNLRGIFEELRGIARKTLQFGENWRELEIKSPEAEAPGQIFVKYTNI